MVVLALGSALAGSALIGLTLYDIIATVLHPQAQSPISNRSHRLGWGLLRLVAGRVRSPALRHTLLGWGLPLLIGGLIALWVLLLLVGFALLYAPWLGDTAYFSIPSGATGSVAEALYYSGASLTTVGYGDFRATHGLFRALSIAEAASGFVVISLSVAYLLAVYPALGRVQTLAVALDAEVAGQPGGLPLVRRYLAIAGGWEDDLAARFRELAQALLDLTGVHETHPVLYYAHPPSTHHSFLRVLITAQGLIGQCRYGLSPDKHGTIVRNPQLALLEQSLLYALRRLSASLHIPEIRREDAASGDETLATDFARICRDLDRLGLVSALALDSTPVAPIVDASDADPTRDSGSEVPQREGATRVANRDDAAVGDPAHDTIALDPVAAYVAFRQETDAHLLAYASACGYTLDEARRVREVAQGGKSG